MRAFFFLPSLFLSRHARRNASLSLSFSLFPDEGARAVFFCPRVVVRRLLNSFLGGREKMQKEKKDDDDDDDDDEIQKHASEKEEDDEEEQRQERRTFPIQNLPEGVIAHVFSFLPRSPWSTACSSSKQMYRAAMSDGTCWKKQCEKLANIEV